MLIKKKIFHYLIKYFSKKNNSIIKFAYFLNIIKLNFFFIFINIYKKKNNDLREIYLFNIEVKTKYLFILTLYIIYSKFLKQVNLFFFRFNVLKKKQKKLTILRAPCNHKNSKEQYGIDFYKGNFETYLSYNNNKLYHYYLISFLSNKKHRGINSLIYTLKLNE